MLCANQICNVTRQSLQLHLQTCMHNCVCICVLQQVACLCFSLLQLSFSGTACSQSLLTTGNCTVFLHEACLHVCHIKLLYYLVFWSQGQMNILSLSSLDAPNSELGHPKDFFKVYVAERVEKFSARVFSQQKICFLKVTQIIMENLFIFFLQGEEYFRQSLPFLRH